jgi:nucleotide-binding universal stress UspA family protein
MPGHLSSSTDAAPGPVLACVGRAPWAGSQARTAAGLARALGLGLEFLHITPDAQPTQSVRDAVLTQAPGAGFTAVTHAGGPDGVILAHAQRRQASLIYAGAAPRESLVTDLIGSTARRLARRARCSVLLDPARGREAERFDHALVLLSPGSVRPAGDEVTAMASALALGGCIGRLTYVLEHFDAVAAERLTDAPPGSGEGGFHDSPLRAEEAGLADVVAGICPAGVPAEARCVEGRDGSGAAALAGQSGADLIIVRAPARVGSLLARFVSDPLQPLLAELPCAVLMVRGSTRGERAA